jgi:hypothetical protein
MYVEGCLLSDECETDKMQFVVGTLVVLFATYLYGSKQQTVKPRPPYIHIHNYENSTMDRNQDRSERNDVSIQLPSTPLQSEGGMATSTPVSPNRHKRKGEGSGYFTPHVD